MQPKATKNCETHTDYYVGPNKFIRFVQNKGLDFMYCSNFEIQIVYTLEQLSDIETSLKIEARCFIIKPIMFI